MLYRFNDIEINLEQYEIRDQDKILSVEPKVFDLIVYLIEHRVRIISRDELFEQVWQGRTVSDTSLSNHIKSARKLLGDSGELQQVIKTVRSRGYQFIADITEINTSNSLNPEKKATVDAAIQPMAAKTEQVSKPVKIKQWFTIIAFMVLLIISLFALFQTALEDKQNTRVEPNIIVVPFSIASNNTERWEAFSDQITRELIQDLRKISGLTVVPPPSSFTFKENKVRTFIRNQLPEVNYVVDGVISEGTNGNLRISVELENINTGELLWNGDFDIQKGYTNLFTIQSEIADSVSKSLQVLMLEKEKETLYQKPTVSLQSYELYMQGQYHLSLMNHEAVLQSIDYFTQAIALDPNFEAAYIAKAKAYRIIMVFFDKPKDVLPKVISSAIALLAINPDSAQIKSSLGLAYVHAWMWEDAWKMLSQARAKDPTIATTELGFALYHAAMGNIDAVKSTLAQANKLDPLNEEIADWGVWALMMVGELDAASQWGYEKLKRQPNMAYVSLGLAIVEYMQGNIESSIELATQGVNYTLREPLPLIILAQAYAANGEKSKARELIIEAQSKQLYMCPYETAIVYTLMNENEQVFPLLNEAQEYQSNCLIFAKHDPRFESLRNDKRYIELLQEIGLDDESIKTYPMQ